MKQRPHVLVVAGYDPTGGAGVLADIKTLEQHKCYGMAVITANTEQTESNFYAPNWIDENIVFSQTDRLLENYRFPMAKIGMIPSLDFAETLFEKLLAHNQKIKIIWDPVLAASAGEVFMAQPRMEKFTELLRKVYMLTPNIPEALQITGKTEVLDAARILASYTRIYLKGGHHKKTPGKDYLLHNGKIYPLNPKNKQPAFPKHGSGCVLTSALAANIAKGYPLLKACLRSKRYIEKVLSSNASLLGYHKR